MMQSEELLPSEVYEYANGIHRSAERLYRLIQNYLLYSKLLLLRSQGQAKFTSPYPCSSLIVISSISERKAIELGRMNDLELDIADIDLAVSSEDLSKIVEELSDNAFKYSSIGSKVSFCSSVVDANWVFTIKDNGRGMNQEQVANIGAYMQFERQFYEQQGMGLGLVLAKTLVEFYGGDIQVNSEENVGTTVCIKLPL